MMFGRKHLISASLLILVMFVFRGQTQTCHGSDYDAGNKCCPKCAPGYRVKADCLNMNSSTSCLPCTPGTYMNHPTGLKQCFPCTHCNAGSGLTTKTPCATTSDTVCEPLDGYYCMDFSKDSCLTAQKHTICQPGQYISQNGTPRSDTACSDCSDGTYSDGRFTSCWPHKLCEEIDLQLIKAGTPSTDAVCGEQSSNQTGIWIGVVVGLLFLLAVTVFVTYYLIKRKGCLTKEDGERNVKPKSYASKKEDMHVGEASVMIAHPSDETVPGEGD